MNYYRGMGVGIPKPDGEEPLMTGADLTPTQMRQQITRARRDSHLIRHCANRAEADGLTGEDAMTVIAYYALRWLEDSYERELDAFNMRAVPPMIIDNPWKPRILKLRAALTGIKTQSASALFSVVDAFNIADRAIEADDAEPKL